MRQCLIDVAVLLAVFSPGIYVLLYDEWRCFKNRSKR